MTPTKAIGYLALATLDRLAGAWAEQSVHGTAEYADALDRCARDLRALFAEAVTARDVVDEAKVAAIRRRMAEGVSYRDVVALRDWLTAAIEAAQREAERACPRCGGPTHCYPNDPVTRYCDARCNCSEAASEPPETRRTGE